MFEEEPSPEVLEIRRIRELALRTPLRRNDTLSWIGPTHISTSLPPDNYPQHHSTIAQSPRPAFDKLLDSRGPAKSSSNWEMRLVEPLQVGTNEPNHAGQVWRIRITDEAGIDALEGGTVVIKLYHEALFPDPLFNDWDRSTPQQLEEKESQVYIHCRQLQGTVIPICYGFYTFKLPSGELVNGVVLEDLTEISETMKDYADWLRRNGRLSSEMVTNLVSSIDDYVSSRSISPKSVGKVSQTFAILERIHQLDVSTTPHPDDLFVLRENNDTDPRVMMIDFSESTTRAELEEVVASETPGIQEDFPGVPESRLWMNYDHYGTMVELFETIGEEVREWQSKESKENNLNLALGKYFYDK
ncbi:uncharacterized protein JCM6883_001181 [Sporobolomyces salmoneus]|uniref:uncharacterized protein n=1 Tax=Sporobolomyces salmoneus TaxID=183962 RepID=UPI00316B188B